MCMRHPSRVPIGSPYPPHHHHHHTNILSRNSLATSTPWLTNPPRLSLRSSTNACAPLALSVSSAAATSGCARALKLVSLMYPTATPGGGGGSGGGSGKDRGSVLLVPYPAYPTLHTPYPIHTLPYTPPTLHTPYPTHTLPYTHSILHTPYPTHHFYSPCGTLQGRVGQLLP